MRFKLAAALLVVTLAATAAHGAKLSGMGANIFGNAFNFAKANLQQAPVSAIAVGGFAVKLQSTRLADLQKRFGGTLMTSGEGAEAATWLCYHTGTANAWFLSNALGGQEFVMMVAVEASNKMPADCEPAAENFAVPDFGIPGLGATTAELKATFGAASGSKIAYRADRPGGYADIAQYIGYILKGGKVVGLGVGETSVPTQH
ncbi:MAG TPA: hypothetical protein GYA10_16515 [Alphaproteobacteria bacterium]|nr:hypothetical protein [Alphaproteobacteria bacterium]